MKGKCRSIDSLCSSDIVIYFQRGLFLAGYPGGDAFVEDVEGQRA
jgi:hypothetical protein